MKIFSTILFWMSLHTDILNSECFIVNKHEDYPLSTFYSTKNQVFRHDPWTGTWSAENHGSVRLYVVKIQTNIDNPFH